ncbi:hypothetical protein ACMD2_03058 [Ananas comosus]|uniref:Bifunctional inhibitor/plant lipid transfer protein/seed storage helical domain-containing protein n=1 Tax=Ananas comosus TaxID=4615 RepID=A0A199VIG5_ANACO|nr:hypothetical protein ACMD2_03058 [Ananas comosus]
MGYTNCSKKFAASAAAVAVVAAAVILSGIKPVLGQTNLPCVQELVPCAIYLNSTNPPASCCNPLKNAFTNELPCACAVFQNPAILKGLGLDVTTGLALIRHCNITGVSPSLCSSAPTPATTPPTPTPGLRPNGANSLYRATWTGMSGAFSLLFMFLWFIVV